MNRRLVATLLAGTALLAACGSPEVARSERVPSAEVTTAAPEIPRGSGDGDVTGRFGDKPLDGDWTVTCEPLTGGNLHVEADGPGDDSLDVYQTSGGDLGAFDLRLDGLRTTDRTGVGKLEMKPTDTGYRIDGAQYANGETELVVDVTVVCPA
ncbi:MAG: hypothetical protein PGN07_10375 [Aeromicrobium erythreum]